MKTTTIASSIPNDSLQFVCGAKVSTPEEEIDFLEAFGPDFLRLSAPAVRAAAPYDDGGQL